MRRPASTIAWSNTARSSSRPVWKPVTTKPSSARCAPRPAQHRGLGAGGEEHHHVAGEHDRVERLGLALRRQIEFAQIGDQPPRPRMIDLGRGDQFRVGIDADHVMADRVQIRTDPTRAAPGVEDPGVATRPSHRRAGPRRPGRHRRPPWCGTARCTTRCARPSCRSPIVSAWPCRPAYGGPVDAGLAPTTRSVTADRSWHTAIVDSMTQTAIRSWRRRPRRACRSRSSPAIPTWPTPPHSVRRTATGSTSRPTPSSSSASPNRGCTRRVSCSPRPAST